MADFFVDQWAYGKTSNRLGLDNPVWGVPQEGDGSAAAASAAASIASITFSAVPSGTTMAIFGAASTGLLTNVTTAASADAAANQLATNINASVNAVSATYANRTPALKNFVYARGPAGGAPAGTCQIMCRIGSAALNVTGIATDCTNTTTAAFSGGAGGCWGWVVNEQALGGSNTIAVMTYGIAIAKPYLPIVLPTALDFIYCRTNKAVVLGAVSWNGSSRGYPMNLIVDNGQKWTGASDIPSNIFDVQFTTVFNSLGFYSDGSSGNTNGALIAAMSPGGFRISVTTTGGSFATMGIGLGGFSRYHNVEFLEVTGASINNSGLRVDCGSTGTLRFSSCKFSFPTAKSQLNQNLIANISSAFGGSVEFDDCDINYNITGSPGDGTPLIQTAIPSSSVPCLIRFRRCRINTGGSVLLKWLSGSITLTSNTLQFQYLFEDNTGAKLDSTAIGIQRTPTYNRPAYLNIIQHRAADSGRPFRLETFTGIAEWSLIESSGFAQPTLNATQPDGTKWSYKLTWFGTGNGCLTTATPFVAPAMTLMNRITPEAARTITLEMLTDSAITINSNMVGMTVYYTDTSGTARSERTFLNAAPVSSSQVWTGASNFSGFAAMKLSLTTSYAVKANTEIAIDFGLYAPPGSANSKIFIDPEFSIS